MTTPMALVGGHGFIEHNLLVAGCKAPVSNDFLPCVIDDRSSTVWRHAKPEIPCHIGPYQSAEAVAFPDEILDVPLTFVFLAGEIGVAESKDSPVDFIAANTSEPSKFVIERMRSRDHFILISIADALEVSVDAPCCSKHFYCASKACEEMVLEEMVQLRGTKFPVVCLTNVLGVHSVEKRSAIHAFTRAAIAGETVTVNGDGQQSRDFIFSRDVGFGVATLANRVQKGAATNKVNMLGSGVSTSLMDVIHTIEAATGNTLKYNQIPAEDLIATEPRDVIARKSDTLVLLEGHITPFVDGIRATYAYYSRETRA